MKGQVSCAQKIRYLMHDSDTQKNKNNKNKNNKQTAGIP